VHGFIQLPSKRKGFAALEMSRSTKNRSTYNFYTARMLESPQRIIGHNWNNRHYDRHYNRHYTSKLDISLLSLCLSGTLRCVCSLKNMDYQWTQWTFGSTLGISTNVTGDVSELSWNFQTSRLQELVATAPRQHVEISTLAKTSISCRCPHCPWIYRSGGAWQCHKNL
jgi:hypothetical protein